MPRRNRNAPPRRRPRNVVRHEKRCWQTSKLGYSSQGAAEAALRDIREKRVMRGDPDDAIEKRVYFHETCGLWHLTHKTDGEYMKRREERGL
jgi:hypothetical protein